MLATKTYEVRTVIGNDLFTHFRSTGSKSRLDFLEHLCAGDLTYTVNDEALDYMRRMKLPEKTIVLFASHPHRIFRGEDAWQVHLATLGIDRITVKPDPIKIVTTQHGYPLDRQHIIRAHSIVNKRCFYANRSTAIN